ncbi:transmembrane regulator PrtR [Corallococcus sp. ZKHCc1 1396]|uniref:Transmembrane regulator PrtR n=1 Tax=Corallococcus soli TaxID=2710757 RepID=A0ABR9PMZ4_9BACT|nr:MULTISPECIES: zf-HC2 domain-containing protein [Corallococcus]MBE4749229.1 transmembrane regulator PrtR [Corallococcus soli]MCY1033773.1 zf-HC2 domain-containing protein [Corallococcus sp. BB11-1]
MTCQELERLLYPYLDGEFQPEERHDVESHLEDCPACIARVDEEMQLRQTLRRAAKHSVSAQGSRAPASLRAGIQSGLHREQRRAQVSQWIRAGAVALVAVTVGGAWMTYQSGQAQRASILEAVQRHTRQRPLEFVAGTPEQIEAWFNDKVEHRITLPRLQQAQPVGARFSTLNGQEVVYVSYETQPRRTNEPKRNIGVFVYPATGRRVTVEESPTVANVAVDSSQAYNVVTWRDHDITYELVTDLDDAAILQMLRDQEHRSNGLPRPAQVKPSVSVQNVSLQPVSLQP